MTVNRIRKLDIERHNSLFYAVYGAIAGEFFLDDDMNRYTLWKQLYLYLHEKNYHVLFYDSQSVRSFSSTDIDAFYNKPAASPAAPTGKYVAAHIKSPFRNRRLAEPKTAESKSQPETTFTATHCQSRDNDTNDLEYFTPREIGIADIERIVKRQDEQKFVLIIDPAAELPTLPECMTSPGSKSESEVKWLELFRELDRKYVANRWKSKILLIYPSHANISSFYRDGFQESPTFFYGQYFSSQFVTLDRNNQPAASKSSLRISYPDKEEICNLLNYKRLAERIDVFASGVNFDKLILRYAQKTDSETNERMMLKDMDNLDLKREIESLLHDRSAWDRLNELKGIDSIKHRFSEFIKLVKVNRTKAKPVKIRPHMVFTGNPGTGKTTVAKLFGEILQEEGVLETGQFISSKAGDLIGQYVGETRIKAQKRCEAAKGGVLFIDEAYGLSDKSETVNYGKEAIEVIIQFMENDNDSLVIFAGYPEQMKELISEGNVGFESRFSEDMFFHFEDYSPDVLLDIAKSQLADYSLTQDAEEMLKRILEKKYQQRNSKWGNAREVGTVVQQIMKKFYASGDTEIDIKHIPADMQQLVEIKEAGSGMAKLNNLIGLTQMKTTLSNILTTIKQDKLRAETVKGYKSKDCGLNFVFRGNPGTGKTTVAGFMGKILHEYGLLSSSEVVECRRESIVAQYVGQTAPRVEKLFRDAIGKTLFIDEAYSLKHDEHDQFGQEAIDTIVGLMTDSRYVGKMAFVIAGYPAKTDAFIASNPGLKRRFNYFIDFEDYTNDDLLQIFEKKVVNNGFLLSDGCSENALAWFGAQPRGEDFANAGLADRLFGIVKSNLDRRTSTVPDADLMTVTPEDFH
jgi:SpoVK/Ycf46/Vps4 family AAA+-type ATPase